MIHPTLETLPDGGLRLSMKDKSKTISREDIVDETRKGGSINSRLLALVDELCEELQLKHVGGLELK